MNKRVLLMVPLLLSIFLSGCMPNSSEILNRTHSHASGTSEISAKLTPETSETPQTSSNPMPGSVGSALNMLDGAEGSQTSSQSNAPIVKGSPQANIDQNSAEWKIRKALSMGGSVVFRVLSDFTYENVQGVQTYGSEGSITDSASVNTNAAKNILGYYLFNQVIRIENGVISMDDADYQCQMSASDEGISIRITSGDYTSVEQGEMSGILSGNTLSGSMEVSSLTVVNNQSNGYTVSGQFTVSLEEAESSQLPPKPPVNLHYTKNGDSITLTWEDPNPAGTVTSFEIFGSYGTMDDYETVATVKDATEWTDTSGLITTLNYDAISYYIIAHGVNGTKSELSDFVSIYIY